MAGDHKCTQCGAQFDSQEELDKHNKEMHGAQQQ